MTVFTLVVARIDSVNCLAKWVPLPLLVKGTTFPVRGTFFLSLIYSDKLGKVELFMWEIQGVLDKGLTWSELPLLQISEDSPKLSFHGTRVSLLPERWLQFPMGLKVAAVNSWKIPQIQTSYIRKPNPFPLRLLLFLHTVTGAGGEGRSDPMNRWTDQDP